MVQQHIIGQPCNQLQKPRGLNVQHGAVSLHLGLSLPVSAQMDLLRRYGSKLFVNVPPQWAGQRQDKWESGTSQRGKEREMAIRATIAHMSTSDHVSVGASTLSLILRRIRLPKLGFIAGWSFDKQSHRYAAVHLHVEYLSFAAASAA